MSSEKWSVKCERWSVICFYFHIQHPNNQEPTFNIQHPISNFIFRYSWTVNSLFVVHEPWTVNCELWTVIRIYFHIQQPNNQQPATNNQQPTSHFFIRYSIFDICQLSTRVISNFRLIDSRKGAKTQSRFEQIINPPNPQTSLKIVFSLFSTLLRLSLSIN